MFPMSAFRSAKNHFSFRQDINFTYDLNLVGAFIGFIQWLFVELQSRALTAINICGCVATIEPMQRVSKRGVRSDCAKWKARVKSTIYQTIRHLVLQLIKVAFYLLSRWVEQDMYNTMRSGLIVWSGVLSAITNCFALKICTSDCRLGRLVYVQTAEAAIFAFIH